MSVLSKPIIASKYASNAATTEYTSTGMRTIIDKFTGYNDAAGAVTLTVYLVPSGSTAAATNMIVLKSLAAGETYTFPELVGHTLDPGDFISVIASAATDIVIRATGRQVT